MTAPTTAHPIEGGCLCGAVRYAITAAPVRVCHCHCRMCQRATGASFATWAEFPFSAVDFTSGRPSVYQSSDSAERGFCTDCGASLSFRYVTGDTIDIACASLDEPDAMTPEDNLWTSTRRRYLHGFDDTLPSYAAARTTAQQSSDE